MQTSIQRTKITTSCNPIKSFCRSAASSGGYAAFFCCLRQPVAALAAIFSALRRYPCRDSTLRAHSAALGGFSFRLAAVSLPGQHTPCAVRRPRRHPSLLLPQQISPPFKPLRQPQVRHNHRSFRRALPERPCRLLRSCRAPQHGSPARHTAKADPDTGQKCCR